MYVSLRLNRAQRLSFKLWVEATNGSNQWEHIEGTMKWKFKFAQQQQQQPFTKTYEYIF